VDFIDRIAGPDGRNLTRLSQGLELTDEQTRTVVEAVVPEIRHYLEGLTLSRGGLADVVAIIGNGAQRDFLDPATDITSQDAIARGNQLLDQIWQTKYRSRLVADRAAAETGVAADKIRQMLPRLANLTFAGLSTETQTAFDDIFSRFTGFPTNTRADQGFGPGQSPLPLPDDNWGGNTRNRYDDLSDVLRRPGSPVRGNPLWAMVRQILGSVLDFRSNSVVGYIIRLLIYRYGWRILSAVLSRIFR
jgi:hypothetical protein